MSLAKITLIGFYNYLERQEDDLFKFLTVPAGIDKNLLINNILLRGGEFEIMYADPIFMQNMIGVWSGKWQRTMKRWIDALSIDYNPLENYDRTEDWTDNGSRLSSENTKANQSHVASGNVSETEERNDETTSNGMQSDQNSGSNDTTFHKDENAMGADNSTSSGSGNNTNTRSAYNSSTYQPHDKADTTSNGTTNASSLTSAIADSTESNTNDANVTHIDLNSNNSKSDATRSTDTNNIDSSSNSINTNNVDNTANVHAGRIHGNIGVTTSQQMLTAELDVSKWNIYEEITDLFLNEFCLYVY